MVSLGGHDEDVARVVAVDGDADFRCILLADARGVGPHRLVKAIQLLSGAGEAVGAQGGEALVRRRCLSMRFPNIDEKSVFAGNLCINPNPPTCSIFREFSCFN